MLPDGNDGFTHPTTAAPQSIFAIPTSNKKENPISDTNNMISFSILLYAFVNAQNNTKTRIRILPSLIGIWNNICSAIAPPSISAIAVATAANIAVRSIRSFNSLGIYLLAASDRHSPVAIPRCAALCCSTISITVDNVTIHNNSYPKPDPAAIFEAQFPGSMNPTVTRSPGPR